MKKLDANIGWGLLLMGLGILFLLQTLGILVGGWAWVMSPIFLVAGGAFIYVFITRPEQWWAIIPGLTLAGIGLLIAISSLDWGFGGQLGGAIFMGCISLAFLIIYARNRDFWWAIIPGGVLASIALMILVGEILPDTAAAGLFFLGMGATFGLVYLLPSPEGKMTWALFPGGILGGMGLIMLIAALQFLRWLFPLAIIALGVYLVYRALVRPAMD